MKSGKISVFVVVLLLIGFLAVVSGWLWLSSPPPAIALPTPNGYDTLIEASSSVQQEILSKEDATLKEFLALNDGPLKLVDEALEMDCVVPIDFSAGMANLPPLTRSAFRLLDARARVLRLDGDSHAAALEWARMFSYASKAAEGGAIVHMLVSVACENMALTGLQSVATELSDEQKQEVLAIVEEANRQPHDLAAMLDREYAVIRGEYGVLYGAYLTKAAGALSKSSMDASKDADDRILTLLQDVTASLKKSP